MKKLWLDIGNTRLKYWITEQDRIIEHAAEMHLQSPADLLLGLIQHFMGSGLHQVGISSVLDKQNNERILKILKRLNIPVIFAKVHAEYAGLICGYDDPAQLGIDRWLQVLAVATSNTQNYCVISCGTALTIDLAQANPEKQIKKMEAIIQSMTVKERRNPDLMNPSRKKRIAAGCGMDVAEVNKLIKQHAQMAKMMKKFANPSGMAKMMKSLGGLQKQFGGGGGMGPLFGGNDKK
jgi:hypothetical protein